MPSIYDLPLSPGSLLLMFVPPFAYYGYHGKFWYEPQRLKFFDFLLQAVCAVLVVFFAIRLYGVVMLEVEDDPLLVMLHIAPLVLTFIAVSRGKDSGGGESATRSDDTGYKPVAKNSEIEEIAWDDLIISDDTKQELRSVINLLKDPKVVKDYGIALPKGILLSGPPGTGKTTIAKAVATMAGLDFFVLRANDVVSKWVGESEKNLTKLFDTAAKHAPAVIFIDEIDSLGKKRSESNAAHADNLLNHLLQLIDGVLKTEGIYIIAATNRPELVDEALKRAGRLNRTIEIPLPDYESRRTLFRVYSRKLRMAPDVDIDTLAKVTEGNSGADVKAICNQAGLHAFQREQKLAAPKRTHLVTSDDFQEALALFEVNDEVLFDVDKNESKSPQAVNSKVEKISWGDIIIDSELKRELQSVVELLKDPATAERYGIKVPKGILLNGPPGTGKTTLAKVIANEAGLSFFSLQADEVISKWVGESEKNLTRLFQVAAKQAPSVIFIDEIDSIAKNRAEGNAAHADNLLNHLLQLIDGVVSREGVYIIGATNRADLVDPALKRGGRLNKVIQVPLPSQEAREALFGMFLAKLPLSNSVDIVKLARRTEGHCAADIREICNQAGLNAFKRESARGSREYTITLNDLDSAVEEWARTR